MGKNAAHGRVLDEVEQVGGVAPQVRRRGGAQLAPQLPPGRDPVGAVSRRIVDPQQRRDDFAHGVVQDQAVRAELHERQRAQQVVGLVRGYIRQQGTEERHGRPAQCAGGVEHGPGRLVEAGKVDPGEFGDDGGDRGVGDRKALAPDGTVLVVEPAAADDYAANLASPMAALSYAASTFQCTPAALAQPGGVALGAQAGPAAVRQLAGDAGFSRFREVVQDAIRFRGTTLLDEAYVDVFGKPGEFQNELKVYGRTGQACRRCRTPIVAVKVGGRTSYYCPQCQS